MKFASQLAKEIVSVQPMTATPNHFLDYAYGGNVRNITNFTVTVKTTDLVETLKANLNKHRAEFEEAMAGYKEACIKCLRKRASLIANGKTEEEPEMWVSFQLPCPRSYANHYEQLLQMLEMATDDELKIDGTQFRQWIQDEWDWKDSHVATRMLYSS